MLLNKNHFSYFPLSLFFLSFFFSCYNGTTINQEDAIPIPVVSLDDPAIVPVSHSMPWWIERHNDRLNVTNNQKVIFIGDSITHEWEGTEAWTALNEKYNSRITNLGFGWDQTQHIIWRLENGEFSVGINPEYVVIMIGTNNRHDPKSIAAGIGKIIKIINLNSPDTKIILLSILPRGTGNDDENTIRNNNVNEIIKKYDGYLRVKYLNIGQYYLNSDGTLKEELFRDRLHLTLAGYNLWREKLIEIIE
jgi:lysophospholipase L1-like esterase